MRMPKISKMSCMLCQALRHMLRCNSCKVNFRRWRSAWRKKRFNMQQLQEHALSRSATPVVRFAGADAAHVFATIVCHGHAGRERQHPVSFSADSLTHGFSRARSLLCAIMSICLLCRCGNKHHVSLATVVCTAMTWLSKCTTKGVRLHLSSPPTGVTSHSADRTEMSTSLRGRVQASALCLERQHVHNHAELRDRGQKRYGRICSAHSSTSWTCKSSMSWTWSPAEENKLPIQSSCNQHAMPWRHSWQRPGKPLLKKLAVLWLYCVCTSCFERVLPVCLWS